MPKVFVSSVIHAPVDSVWKIVRGFNSLPSWHPLVTDSIVENGDPDDRVGCIRKFTQTSGAVLRERLCALNDLESSLNYEIVEATLPVENYNSTIQLFPITHTNETFATWSVTFSCDKELQAQIVQDLKASFLAGFCSLEEMLSRRGNTLVAGAISK